MAEVSEKFPQWVHFRTNDMSGPEGRYIIGLGDEAGWASYGRYFALRQMLATSPLGYIDVSDARSLGYLTRSLGFARPKACREWLDMLAVAGGIDMELWSGRQWVLDASMQEQLTSYQSRCRTLRRNGEKGGRPAKSGGEAGA